MSFTPPSKFYAMIDTARGHDPVELARIYLNSGARVMQLRLKDVPAGAMLMGLAIRGKPPKTHQKAAKKAAGAYQEPPDLLAAHAIAGSSRKMAAVSQFTPGILSSGWQPARQEREHRRA